MQQSRDITNLDDIKKLVDLFYGKVRENTLLAPVFNDRIGDRWPQHLARMYTFWETVLLDEKTYFGAPFPPHARMPIDHDHFAQWMELFVQTIDELFSGERAEEAKWRAGKMAQMFELKINQIRTHYPDPLF